MKTKIKSKSQSVKSVKMEKGTEIWMDPPIGDGPRIKVKILKNEFQIQDNMGGKLRTVHAYTVQEVDGQNRKWTLVPETRIHEQDIDII